MRLGHVVRALGAIGACKLRKCAEHKVRAKIRTHFRKACRETSFEFSLCRTSLIRAYCGSSPSCDHLTQSRTKLQITTTCIVVWFALVTICASKPNHAALLYSTFTDRPVHSYHFKTEFVVLPVLPIDCPTLAHGPRRKVRSHKLHATYIFHVLFCVHL